MTAPAEEPKLLLHVIEYQNSCLWLRNTLRNLLEPLPLGLTKPQNMVPLFTRGFGVLKFRAIYICSKDEYSKEEISAYVLMKFVKTKKFPWNHESFN